MYNRLVFTVLGILLCACAGESPDSAPLGDSTDMVQEADLSVAFDLNSYTDADSDADRRERGDDAVVDVPAEISEVEGSDADAPDPDVGDVAQHDVWDLADVSGEDAPDLVTRVTSNNEVFDIGVVVVSDDYAVSPEDLGAAMALVDDKFRAKTGFGVRLLDVVETTREEIEERRTERITTEQWYFDTHRENPPEGLIVYIANASSTSYGGYSTTVDFAGDGFCNEFESPTTGATHLYVSTIDWDHHFGRCGYDEDGDHVSDVSIGGECRNVAGTPCVDHGDYWICQNLVDDPRADPATFRMFTIVHEFMHPFTGPTGPGYGHHGTDWCNEVTGGEQGEFNDTVGICPIAFENFSASHHLCD